MIMAMGGMSCTWLISSQSPLNSLLNRSRQVNSAVTCRVVPSQIAVNPVGASMGTGSSNASGHSKGAAQRTGTERAVSLNPIEAVEASGGGQGEERNRSSSSAPREWALSPVDWPDVVERARERGEKDCPICIGALGRRGKMGKHAPI